MALREVLASFGFDIDPSKLLSANKAVDVLSGGLAGLSGLAGGLAAAFGLGVVKGQIDDLAGESAELGRAASKAGLGFEEFQKLSYTSGLSAEKLTGVFRTLQRTTAAAAGKATDAALAFDDLDGGLGHVANSKQATETLKQLGVVVTEDTGQNFDAIIGALAKMPNELQRNALAMKVFGRGGSDLIPFLKKSPEELARLSEEFEAFGGITEEGQKKLKDYTAANKGLNLATRSVKVGILTALVPALTTVVGGMVTAAKWYANLSEGNKVLTGAIAATAAAFGLVSTVGTSAAYKIGAAWARALLPIAVLYVLMDDLVHFIKGDAQTAIGDLFDSILGKGSGDTIAGQMRKDLADLLAEVEEFSGGGWVETILGVVGGIAIGAVNKIGEAVGGLWDLLVTSLNQKLQTGGTGMLAIIKQIGRSLGYALVEAIELVPGVSTLFKALGVNSNAYELERANAADKAAEAATKPADDAAFLAARTRDRDGRALDGSLPSGTIAALRADVGAKTPTTKITNANKSIVQNNAVTVNVANGTAAGVKAGVAGALDTNLSDTADALEGQVDDDAGDGGGGF